jgi:hypothetical protein
MKFTDDDLKRLKDRFFEKVHWYEGCLMWVGSRSGSGYGQMQFGKRKEMAHRISYQLFVGPIPEGETIDHKCERKLCVLHTHLQPMPMLQNVMLGSKAQNTHCPQGHPFEGHNLIWNGTSRMCRICKNTNNRKRWERVKDKRNADRREAWRKAAGK